MLKQRLGLRSSEHESGDATYSGASHACEAYRRRQDRTERFTNQTPTERQLPHDVITAERDVALTERVTESKATIYVWSC
jgi:hypothetical protein